MGFLLKGVIGLFVFSYGFFSVGKYFVQAIKLGLFFKSSTEKETLELQLGTCHKLDNPLPLILCPVVRWAMDRRRIHRLLSLDA